jgi:hypothetical protein
VVEPVVIRNVTERVQSLDPVEVEQRVHVVHVGRFPDRRRKNPNNSVHICEVGSYLICVLLCVWKKCNHASALFRGLVVPLCHTLVHVREECTVVLGWHPMGCQHKFLISKNKLFSKIIKKDVDC